MHTQTIHAAAAAIGALTLGLSPAFANPFSYGGSTVSSTGESRSSSSTRDKAQGVLESMVDNVLSVRFGAAAATAASAGDVDQDCEETKKDTRKARETSDAKKEEKEPVGPEPIYFGF